MTVSEKPWPLALHVDNEIVMWRVWRQLCMLITNGNFWQAVFTQNVPRLPRSAVKSRAWR